MMKPENLQDRFLNQARKDRTQVTLFLMNGFQLRGSILASTSLPSWCCPTADRI